MCRICGKPLSDAERRLRVTAHFPCVVEASYGAVDAAYTVRDAVLRYLRGKYGSTDLTWHPLFTATRGLFTLLVDGR